MMHLSDRFDVIRQIGEGGFGRVLVVQERSTGEHLAAKVMKGRVTKDARQRFAREVKQLLHYSKLGVVPIREAFVDAQRPFFTMELASSSLEGWAGKMNAGQVAIAMLRVMEVLAAIHADGGFHRDVKPGNLLLLSKGQTVVGDFGLGNNPKLTNNFTREARGTVVYMAPEVLEHGAFTSACDVYSAGATWYHLMTGELPKPVGGPLDPRKATVAADVWMSEWIEKMTQRSPTLRPSAATVVAALRQHLRPQPAPPPLRLPTITPGAAAWNPSGNDLLAAGVVIGALALIIAIAKS